MQFRSVGSPSWTSCDRGKASTAYLILCRKRNNFLTRSLFWNFDRFQNQRYLKHNKLYCCNGTKLEKISEALLWVCLMKGVCRTCQSLRRHMRTSSWVYPLYCLGISRLRKVVDIFELKAIFATCCLIP